MPSYIPPNAHIPIEHVWFLVPKPTDSPHPVVPVEIDLKQLKENESDILRVREGLVYVNFRGHWLSGAPDSHVLLYVADDQGRPTGTPKPILRSIFDATYSRSPSGLGFLKTGWVAAVLVEGPLGVDTLEGRQYLVRGDKKFLLLGPAGEGWLSRNPEDNYKLMPPAEIAQRGLTDRAFPAQISPGVEWSDVVQTPALKLRGPETRNLTL